MGAGWAVATVRVAGTVTEGPEGRTYALSGGLAALLAGRPNDGFALTPVTVG